VDAEGARALARRIAAQEQAAEPAAPGNDGQTLHERLAKGPVSRASLEERPAEAALPRVELRSYAREVEEQFVAGRRVQVEIWSCRACVRGVWQAPYVVREVIREAPPAPEDALASRLNSVWADSDRGLYRVLWRLVALGVQF
jgi:hypothetical protein